MTERVSRKKCVSLFLLSILLVIMNGSSQAQATAATIEYYNDGTTKTIEFTSEDLERIKADPHIVEARLEAKGIKCCPPQKQISDCVWKCCDGGQISTCDETLAKALRTIWET